jgi:hypothetical protein
MVIVNLLLLIPGGILVYIYFQGCNPMYTRKVVNKNQMGAYWLYLVLNEYIPTFCGIMFASLVFAAVVQHSHGMAVLAKAVLNEIASPLLANVRKANSLLQKRAVHLLTIVVLTLLSISLAVSLAYVKSTMIALFFLFNNSINSPILGLFLLAAFNPYSNGFGATLAFCSNLAVNFFVGFGSLLVGRVRSQEFTPDIHRCDNDTFHLNLTNLNVYDITHDLHHNVNTTHPHADDFFPKEPVLYFLFTIAPIWYCLFSVVYTFVAGSVFSLVYSLVVSGSCDADSEFAQQRKQYLYVYRMFRRKEKQDQQQQSSIQSVERF